MGKVLFTMNKFSKKIFLADPNAIYQSKNCGAFTVENWVRKSNVGIRFISTGYREIVWARNVCSGSIFDNLYPRVNGVGFIGIGDYNSRADGKVTKAYVTWKNMLARCYCPKIHKKRPTYVGVTVCDEWLDFQKFARWFEKENIEGTDIDKDLLVNGNKLYSPDTCIFVPPEVNTLLLNNKASRGKYMLGATRSKGSRKFAAKCRGRTNKSVHIGYFNTELEAHNAYCEYKYTLIKEVANEQSNLRLKQALLSYTIPKY